MPYFSDRSKRILNTCHIDLQRIMNEAIEEIDFSVICGYRGEEEQNKAYEEGNSNAKFGQSKHNSKPSLAVDVVPYPLNWDDIDSFKALAEVIKPIADKHQIAIRWGGDFTSLKDYPHYELTNHIKSDKINTL